MPDIGALTPEQRDLLIGLETSDVLGKAFPRKRVVHPGLGGGSMVKPERWQADWQALMSRLGAPGKVTAYIHIPFCQTKCLYCGFFQNFSRQDLEDAYMDRLIADLQANEGTIAGMSRPVHAVYIGGGTPSSLAAGNIRRLLQAVKLFLPLANDCELTFEARIHDFGPEKIEACLSGGANRFSFGVQSFDTRVRKSVGRLDDRDTVLEQLRRIHGYDQAAVVVDLIYGLPYQTMDTWRRDVETLATAAIDGADLYQLNLYDNSALRLAIDEGKLPPAAAAAEQARMFAAGVQIMTGNHFRRLSMCHWGNSGRERNLYNSLSKGGATVLPFGAGAGGSIAGANVALERDVQAYMRRIDSGEKPICFMMAPKDDYRLHAAVVGQIEEGFLDIRQLAARFAADFSPLQPVLEIWQRRGLVEKDDGGVRLTLAGQFWYVNIAQTVLDFISGGTAGRIARGSGVSA